MLGVFRKDVAALHACFFSWSVSVFVAVAHAFALLVRFCRLPVLVLVLLPEGKLILRSILYYIHSSFALVVSCSINYVVFRMDLVSREWSKIDTW